MNTYVTTRDSNLIIIRDYQVSIYCLTTESYIFKGSIMRARQYLGLQNYEPEALLTIIEQNIDYISEYFEN